MHQVFLNICTNAVQALRDRPDGRVEIGVDRFSPDLALIELHPGLTRREHVRVTVRDNGGGMTPEVIERIFEPFFTTKQSGAGTGLGLAVTHSIVHNHGGAILVESAPGSGSAFGVLLPVAVASRGKNHPRHSSPGFLLRGHGEQIVVVDDDPAVEETMRETIRALGYHPTGFRRPEEALAYLNHPSGDAVRMVVTDFSMPGLDGIELTRQIRLQRPKLPLLLVSGYLTTEVLERAQADGLDHHLDKPPALEELALPLAEGVARSDHP